MTQQPTSGSGPTRAESRVCGWCLHTMLTAAPLGARTWKPPDPLAEESVRERPPTRGVLLSLKKDRNPAIGHMDAPGDTVLVEQASHRRTNTEREAVTAARQCERTRYPGRANASDGKFRRVCCITIKTTKRPVLPVLAGRSVGAPRESCSDRSPRGGGGRRLRLPARCAPFTPAVLFQRSPPFALHRPPTSAANS